MVKDEEEIYDLEVYGIPPGGKLNKKKVLLVALFIILIFMLIEIAKDSVDLIKYNKVYEQYATQESSLKQQEETKQARLEKAEEEEKQRKLPNLTNERKK